VSDVSEELAAAVGDLLKSRQADGSAAPDYLDSGLWDELAALGFTGLTVPEELGGSGGDLLDAAVVTSEAAKSGAAVPVAEATFLAGPLLAAAGIELPPGVVTSGSGSLSVSGGRLTGTVPRVPWLRSARYLVTLVSVADGFSAALVPVGDPGADGLGDAAADADADGTGPGRHDDGLTIEPGENLAGEQRDTAVLTNLAPERLVTLPDSDWPRRVELLGAAARAVQIGGAARAVLDLAVTHAGERVQFGRPLSRFQAVQQLLARLAADTTTVTVAADAAVRALRDQIAGAGAGRAPDGELSPGAELLVASAKAQASALAGTIAATGHQVHGAIGFTMEHRLGGSTKRLWSWRQENGNDLYWQRRIAGLVAAAPSGLWPLVSG
jgi:acyl-CoA dehydrogenase